MCPAGEHFASGDHVVEIDEDLRDGSGQLTGNVDHTGRFHRSRSIDRNRQIAPRDRRQSVPKCVLVGTGCLPEDERANHNGEKHEKNWPNTDLSATAFQAQRRLDFVLCISHRIFLLACGSHHLLRTKARLGFDAASCEAPQKPL
jgi:hypothetical protein